MFFLAFKLILKLLGIKKKSFNPLTILFKFASLIVVPVIIVCVLFDNQPAVKEVGIQLQIDDSEDYASQLTEEQQEDVLNQITNGHKVMWSSQVGNVSTNADKVNNNTTNYSVNANYIYSYDYDKITDTDKQRIKEYLEVCEEVGAEVQAPAWIIMAINCLEATPTRISGGVYVGTATFDGYRTYGSTHPHTGEVINYRNYGTEEAQYDGSTSSYKYKGPFQLDSTYGCPDVYNFFEGARTTIKSQKGSSGSRYYTAKNYFEGVTDDDNFIWAVSITMHNTGPAGFMARVPRYGTDTRQHFYDTVMTIMQKPEFVSVSEAMFFDWTTKENQGNMFKLYDGLHGIMYSKELVDNFNIQVTSPIYNPTGTRIKSTPGAAGTCGAKSGTYMGDGNGETTYGQGFKVYMYSNRAGCVIGSVGDKKYGWELDYEAGRYFFGGLTKGRYMENTLRDIVNRMEGKPSQAHSTVPSPTPTPSSSITSTTTSSNNQSFTDLLKEIFGNNNNNTGTNVPPVNNLGTTGLPTNKKLQYYWKDSTLQLSQNPPTAPIEGKFNEVGMKGSFPIFIQSSRSNNASKTPWKYSGGATTLGASGCSLFSLTTLIHGVGFGQMPIPKTTNGVDGLNDEGYICLQEMAVALPNGPIVGEMVAKLGYKIRFVPTTDEGLETLFEELCKGVPFAVNVRGGYITGYDYQYNKHSVQFTTSGHFIVLVGGYNLNGHRFVEVVQSTYSNGGQAKSDQNELVYDFDELKDKKIIRSGSGYCVPAYTIEGMENSDAKPLYMQSGYEPPTRFN